MAVSSAHYVGAVLRALRETVPLSTMATVFGINTARYKALETNDRAAFDNEFRQITALERAKDSWTRRAARVCRECRVLEGQINPISYLRAGSVFTRRPYEAKAFEPVAEVVQWRTGCLSVCWLGPRAATHAGVTTYTDRQAFGVQHPDYVIVWRAEE